MLYRWTETLTISNENEARLENNHFGYNVLIDSDLILVSAVGIVIILLLLLL